ncbi:tetratricopeptide repeat protein [Streptomyces purpurogeneiscleroticus]|uniref:tetratricopeptide repeat protein n=1 Tax=Streptomyces purpurogeneiscleroticus TaxID=68259 RepID=UPI001CBAAC1C|nr:tetratricopeptide repeat protein [Streptomyces purpurogeneiscleroticus]MBZ4020667.1 tetratricopeptide repeat protein [Streptomyces purpurogeneiscleroticus]
MLPPRAQSFQDRAEAERLRAAVEGAGTTALGQVLTGMGGVGKTQLAADYALAAWDNGSGGSLDVLVWVTASSRSDVVAGYAQAGIELCRADPDDPEQAARTFLAWLTPKAGARPCRWLVVLDDVADPDDLRGLWPPAGFHGHTLVTTRCRDAALTGEGRRRIEVGLFTETEAVAYLTRSLAAHDREETEEQLSALADDLGCLPLALSQAAAYAIDSGEDVASYRDLLADRATTLADTAPDRLPDDQALPLAAAWSLSIDRADVLRPAGLARPMLQLAALLDPNGIPETVLTSEPALGHLAKHRPRPSPDATGDPAPVSPRDAARVLRTLHRLSLVDHTPATAHKAVRVHRLIQRATLDTLPHDHKHETARTAADALLAVWPGPSHDTALTQALRSNTAALTDHDETALHQPHAHAVLHRAGTSLGEAGHVAAATAHFLRLTETTTQHLGPDHRDTLAARHGLARWQGEAGDAAGAAAAFEELLADRIRALGQDHPDTLATRNSLARWQGEAGDAAGAAAATEDLLPHLERLLGENHGETLAARSNLARWLGRAGDAPRAAAALQHLLPQMVQLLGEDHPDTLTARNNLANWQGEAGEPAGAAGAFEQLLADRIRVLGQDHPRTLTSRGNLARWKGRAGDAAGAAAAFEELLADRIRVLGETHPHTLNTRHNLAHWRGEAGDAAGAAAAFEELLTYEVRILGADHSSTLHTRSNLLYWRGKATEGVDESTDS